MKMSIRKKIFILITGLITFFVVLSWILNNKFLVQFYFYNKKNALISDFNTINNVYNGNLDEVDLQLEKMERMEGRHIIIEDTSLTIKYDSSPKRFMMPDKPFINQDRQNVINSILEEYKIDELENGKIVIKRTTNSKLKSDFINLIGRLKNGDYIYIGTPVAAIEESVDISNKFFVITGIVTIITGIVAGYILYFIIINAEKLENANLYLVGVIYGIILWPIVLGIASLQGKVNSPLNMDAITIIWTMTAFAVYGIIANYTIQKVVYND